MVLAVLAILMTWEELWISIYNRKEEDERILSRSKMVVLAPTVPHLWSNFPNMFSFNSLEERVHGGSHVMVLLSDAATT